MVSTKAGEELSSLSYTYDLAGNKLTSTETVDGKEEKTTFSYDDNNRLIKLEGSEGIISYSYDKNGNRIAQEKNNEKLEYIYDTENRLLAVKDKDGLLMAALYDGDDNRVFTASRKEGKNTYQLFRIKENDQKTTNSRKSPKTSPNGEENSLFWYGFSQNVLQALSSFPQTVGSIWHSIFDDVSSAYHQKVAKDRATKDGLVVNPPSLGNLPGEGDVTYASEVKDVLIPYTTREDTYKYYEEHNYVNDVNREHTEVLQTYDHDLKARETYSYGHGRTSYLNNQTNKSYQYLTNQSGSVTGLTQDGKAVASSSYQLYGSTKKSTDETGNPYAYNGEARDSTGLDYLRARYYDSHAGTFLTEDSYQGEVTAPLSQNRYAYVHNNPVNYTDPSGHFLKGLINGAKKAWNGVKNLYNRATTFVGNVAKSAVNFGRNVVNWVGNKVSQAANWVGTQVNKATNWAAQQWNNYQQRGVSYQASGPQAYYPSASSYASQQQAQAQAQAEARRQQHIRDEYTQATGLKTTPKTREAQSMFRNWGKALKEMYTHVCTTAKRIKNDTVQFLKKVDWKKVGIAAVATVAAVAVTVATAGAAAPVVAGLVGATGLTGFGAAVATGVAVGAVSGAAGGGVHALTSGVLSGQKPGDILNNTVNGAINGAFTGGLTGGLLGGFGSATSSVANPLARHVVDTVGETATDTIVDATQGGKVTPGSIAASFAINAISEGISVRASKGPKADVAKNKPKSGDVPVTKPLKDVTPVQQLALPGPTSKPLALPEPKSTPKTDFYVGPDGTTLPATGYRYMNSQYADQTVKSMQAPGGYIGFTRFDSAKQVQDAYQIAPDWSDTKLRGEFDTLQIFDNVRVPRAYGDKAGETLEPLTKVYPEFGTGGYPQLITDKAKNINFRDVAIIGD